MEHLFMITRLSQVAQEIPKALRLKSVLPLEVKIKSVETETALAEMDGKAL